VPAVEVQAQGHDDKFRRFGFAKQAMAVEKAEVERRSGKQVCKRRRSWLLRERVRCGCAWLTLAPATPDVPVRPMTFDAKMAGDKALWQQEVHDSRRAGRARGALARACCGCAQLSLLTSTQQKGHTPYWMTTKLAVGTVPRVGLL